MRLRSPQARFRINSSIGDYIKSAKNFLLKNDFNEKVLQQLEAEICQELKIANAIAMPQARVGLYLAIVANIDPGKEIILSPNTIVDVINMVICAGLKPVFCDIDPATGNLDPDLAERLITANTAAILITHLFGLIAPMDRFLEMKSKYGVLLIEDSAQAFGARREKKCAGTIGDIGVYSFGRAKNVMAFYGGMLVTPYKEIAVEICAKLENFPFMSNKKLKNRIISCLIKDAATYDIIFACLLFKIVRYAYENNIGAITRHIEAEMDLSRKHTFPENYKEKMTPLQAKLILAKLDNVEKDFQHRLVCARLYYEGLKDIPELTLPPMIEDGSHVYNYYPVGYEDRESLRMFLMTNNRDVALQHIRNTADLPGFRDFYSDCPNCRKWAHQTIMMPNYTKYRYSEVEKNVLALRTFFGK